MPNVINHAASSNAVTASVFLHEDKTINGSEGWKLKVHDGQLVVEENQFGLSGKIYPTAGPLADRKAVSNLLVVKLKSEPAPATA